MNTQRSLVIRILNKVQKNIITSLDSLYECNATDYLEYNPKSRLVPCILLYVCIKDILCTITRHINSCIIKTYKLQGQS